MGGGVAALGVTRFLSPFLYGVFANGSLTCGAILGLLALVSGAANWVPARPAGRVPRAMVLRAD